MTTLTDGRRIPFFMVENRVFIDYTLNPYEFTVYCCITMHVNREKGYAWPGTERIRELTGICRPTIQKALDKLEEVGLLEVEKSAGKVNRYTLTCKPRLQVNDQPVNPVYNQPVNPVYTNNTIIEQELSDDNKTTNSANAESAPDTEQTEQHTPQNTDTVKAKAETKDTPARPLTRHQNVIRILATALARDKGIDYEALDSADQQPFNGRASKLYSTDLKAQSHKTPIQQEELQGFVDEWRKLYPNWDFPTSGKLGTWFVMWRLHGTLNKKKAERNRGQKITRIKDFRQSDVYEG